MAIEDDIQWLLDILIKAYDSEHTEENNNKQ